MGTAERQHRLSYPKFPHQGPGGSGVKGAPGCGERLDGPNAPHWLAVLRDSGGLRGAPGGVTRPSDTPPCLACAPLPLLLLWSPQPPSPLPVPSLWVVPVHQPQASSLVHRTWTGNSFPPSIGFSRQEHWHLSGVSWCLWLQRSQGGHHIARGEAGRRRGLPAHHQLPEFT